ncbi:MAG TPA: hypothetical protein VH105_18000 [Burkholderiales bacterium]|jgi:hypothetical protein|nr:hypothetical protein [Burkholderiales bacterium]
MSAMLGSGVLALWLDVAPALDQETDHWYIDEHMPERLDIGGYLRARRYEASEATPKYLTMFEAATPAALASEGYLRLVKKISAQSQHIRAGFSNVARNTFRVRVSRGRGLGAVMLSVRLQAAGVGARAVTAMDEAAPRLLRQPGIVGVHWLEAAPEVRAEMDKVRVTGVNDAIVDHVLLIEAARAVDAQRALDRMLPAAELARMGWSLDKRAVYHLLYEVSGPPADAASVLGDRQ